ncbi:cnh domain containing [Anaeramoeba ignava]|uniref:Cnh domain containing n=1 Tax=Anaeramoeba ignava TaxID=1746090 RepID=A0A9Q0LA72_ANAIG|nr:cnh domain containing [Anaeramoeba ignava]
MEKYNFVVVLTKTEVALVGLQGLEPQEKLIRPISGAHFLTAHGNRLIIAFGLKVLLFVYQKKTQKFDEKEQPINLPEKIIRADWIGNGLFLGFSRKYMFVSLKDNIPQFVIDTTRSGTPTSARISKNEIVVGIDEKGKFIDSNGKESQNFQIQWSDVPSLVCHFEPYIVGIINGKIEVINRLTNKVAQQITDIKTVRNITVCQKSKLLLVCDEINVWKLELPSLIEQVTILSSPEYCKYDEAIFLLDYPGNYEKMVEQDKEMKLKEIREMHSFHLFCQKQYSRALEYFDEMNEFDFRSIFYLYPALIKTETLKKLQVKPPLNTGNYDPTQDDIQAAIWALIIFLTKQRGYIVKYISDPAKFPNIKAKFMLERDPNILSLIDTVILKCYVEVSQELIMSFFKFPHNSCDLEESKRVLESKNLVKELVELHRIKLLDEDALKIVSSQYEKTKKADELVSYLKHLNNDKLDLIFKYSGWVIHNFPERAKEIFIWNVRAPRQDELGEIQEKKLFGQLRLNEQNDFNSNTPSNESTTRIAIPSLGKKAFLQMKDGKARSTTPTHSLIQKTIKDIRQGWEEERFLDIKKVINFLQGFNNFSEIPYLEHVINYWDYRDPDVHNTLLLGYLKKAQILRTEKKKLKNSGSDKHSIKTKKSNLKGLKLRMIDFIKNSEYYQPEKMIPHFPIQFFLESRALILSKMGQHASALNIYVHKMKKLEKAEEYCNLVYNEDDPESKQVYLLLLKEFLSLNDKEYISIYENKLISLKKKKTLSEDEKELLSVYQKEQPNKLQKSLDIVIKYFNRIDSHEALSLLPEDIPIEKVYDFLHSIINKTIEKSRTLRVTKNIQQSENFNLKLKLNLIKRGRIFIDSNTICPICHKKIGNSVFVVYPNDKVVHKKCAPDLSLCPVTGTQFGTFKNDN